MDPFHPTVSALVHRHVVNRTNHVLSRVTQSAAGSTVVKAVPVLQNSPSIFSKSTRSPVQFKIIIFQSYFYSFKSL